MSEMLCLAHKISDSLEFAEKKTLIDLLKPIFPYFSKLIIRSKIQMKEKPYKSIG